MPLIGLLIGATLGGWLGHSFDLIVGGGFVGLIAGLIVHQYRKRSPSHAVGSTAARFAAIEARLSRLESLLAPSGLVVAPPSAPTTAPTVPTQAPSDVAASAPIAPPSDEAARGVRAPSIHAAPPVPAYGTRSRAGPNRLWLWIAGGNTLARVGIIVLFVGVAFLLKYAAEHVTVSIELRVAGVAVGGIVLLVLGWRLRERRRAYAMILQGGGVGVLYLTVFSAFKLYALLPPSAAFVLLFAITLLSSWLAIQQDSMALAVIGVIGGFLAPILTSSQSDNHIVLFSYYGLLNTGILLIAWFKAWRLLNLLGFACTFIIGTLWGVTRYRSADFATTEPFLIAFFLFYVGIAVLYALKRSVEVKHYVDGTIVFGTPLVAAGLQHALVHPFKFGMAYSALAMSALYFVLAQVLSMHRREALRLLIESFLALGIVFATLAVPLALDARWTSATWALEGAAIVWVSVRQDRFAGRIFGLLLQAAAAVAFVMDAVDANGFQRPVWPLLNREFVGAALMASGGLVSAWALDRNVERLRSFERAIGPIALAWGALWWLFAGGQEIDRFVHGDAKVAFSAVFLSLSALAFALGARWLAWPLPRAVARSLMALVLLCAFVGIVAPASVGGHLFANIGIFAWMFALASWLALLRIFDADALTPARTWAGTMGHAGLIVLACAVAAEELGWIAREYINPQSVWPVVPWGLVPALGLLLIGALSSGRAWPFGVHRHAYVTAGGFILTGWMMIFALIVNLASEGNSAPLPYFPVVNPLDVSIALIVASIALWLKRLARDGIDLRMSLPREIFYGIPAALLFIWANAIVLRSIHHLFSVPWQLDALWRSTLAQAALSLLWTIIALALMVVANRRGARAGWIAGAVLLAVVVVKLFAVDLSRIAGVERIVSFIGVGVLLLLIGYLAPVPPARKQESPSDAR